MNKNGQTSIQAELRQHLVAAILGGQIVPRDALPSSRHMAKRLGVSRNTVSIVYQGLVDDGYLVSLERRGFFVDEDILKGGVPPTDFIPLDHIPAHPPHWDEMFRVHPSDQRNIDRPANWQDYPYPFIYGQVDKDLFPIVEWRECSRQALGRKGLDAWAGDSYNFDDPLLIDQIRTRLLPRRGIMAIEEQILVTLGAQNGLYLLGSLLIGPDSVVAMEEPGYQAARNVLLLKTPNIKPIAVDDQGMLVDERLSDCDFVFVTPSHQYPTTVTMPMERRMELLRLASKHDFVIIEDDYEFETNYLYDPIPSLKSLDKDDRVIYVGSLSKSLFPGLRLGYLTGPKELIKEARALRRLMLHHPPNNNQRTAALFLSLGYHDTLINRLHRVYRERWQQMGRSLDRYMPGSSEVPSFGGTSYWVKGPEGSNARALALRALDHGVIIEPGDTTFTQPDCPKNFFRLAFSSIALEKIDPGIKILAGLIGSYPHTH